MIIFFNNKLSFMLKFNVITKTAQQLCDLEKFFYQEIRMPDQKISPIMLPFFNFVCYTIDLFVEYAKSPLDISFNVFVIDSHLRKYTNLMELCRRFIGFIDSWKKYSQTDEAKLFLSFLRVGRNNKKSVKLFLKLRKVLLKNINQKVLQQINLTHEDAVTITHTLQIVSPQQRKSLTKKINEYFITKNFKYVNNTRFNAAIICEFFMLDLNEKSEDIDKFSSSNSFKNTQNIKKHQDFIEELSQEIIVQPDMSFSNQSLVRDFQTCRKTILNQDSIKSTKENIQSIQMYETESKKPLVNLQKCMKELFILKEKDLQIDNRFKKFNKVREDIDQY